MFKNTPCGFENLKLTLGFTIKEFKFFKNDSRVDLKGNERRSNSLIEAPDPASEKCRKEKEGLKR